MKKLFRNLNKKIKKMIMHNKIKSIILLVNIVLFILFMVSSGIARAIIFVGSLDLLIYFIYFIFGKKMSKAKKNKVIRMVTFGILGFGIFIMVSSIAFIGLIVLTAPKFDPNNLYRKESSILYDKDGNIVKKLGLEKREIITYDQISEVLIDAIIATEDSRFFQHNGFDLPRFLKASLGQVLGQDAGGASTLTMQVSKNNYTSPVANGFDGIKRKFTDIYMAIFQIEKNYTKKEIVEFYVNEPYLGAGAHGIEQASQTYFGKSASDLNLAEASLIAGLFQAPNRLDPTKNPEGATDRRSTVLSLMERHGYITHEERLAAEAITVESLLTNATTASSQYQAFIDTVVEDVIALTGDNPYEVPMQIYTTMDSDRQEHINKVMSGELFKWENDVVDAGIAVIDSKTGALVAVGAGRNTSGQRQFNNATMTTRQIGSTAKPIYDYGVGIENLNWSTYTPFIDEPYSYTGGIEIGNWDGKYQGFLTSRLALARSRNIPALKAFKSNSNSDIKNFATSLGLSPEIESGKVHEAHALGGYNGESPLTMAAAYASFANGGFYTKPYSFTKIVYRENGEVIENKSQKERVMSEATSYMITSILIDAAKIQVSIPGYNFAAKTGTTNFDLETVERFDLPSNAINDLWFDGYTKDYTISIWYGYAKIDPEYTTPITSRQHAYLFKAIAQGIFKTGSVFTKPSDVIAVQIENGTYPAMLPSAGTPSDMIVTELFKAGSEPTEVSPRYDKLSNITGLDSILVGNSVTLNWTPIDTPYALDTNLLNNYFDSLYFDLGYRTNAYNERIAYNTSHIGEVGYNVYTKDSNGDLTLKGFTKNITFNDTVSGLSNITYVVKSTYSIFNNAEATGSELTINLDSDEGIIYAELNGNSTINLRLGIDAYTEAGTLVYEDSVNVTSNAEIVVSGEVDTNVAGTYTITYQISYKDFTDTLIRTVIVA
jgi:penicillin-binding protein 1A